MSLRLWLIRHAQSTWNAVGRMQGWADPPLSEWGQQQAAWVAAKLAAEPLQALYASPQVRALETAQAIGAAVGLAPLLDARLKEVDMGQAEGCTWDELLARWPHLNAVIERGDFFVPHVPEAEALPAFTARVGAAFAEIEAAHTEGDVAVVAHRGVFRAYLGQLLQARDSYCVSLNFSNASLSRVTIREVGWVDVDFINCVSHLADLKSDE